MGLNDQIKNGDEVPTKNKEIETSYEFWTKKLYMNVTQLDNDKITLTENFFEFQGQANLKNIDVTEWVFIIYQKSQLHHSFQFSRINFIYK